MINVMIADDHPVVLEGLKRVLDAEQDIAVVDEASTMDEVLARAPETQADVLLLDLSMPGPDFRVAMRRLTKEAPRVRVLILSVHPEDQFAVPAIRAGAAGYLTKDQSAELLAEAIRKVRFDGRFITAAVAASLAAEVENPSDQKPHETLSDRELEVLIMLGRGMSVKEIGFKLGISPKTVSTYRERIQAKTDLDGNAAIIRYVIENGLDKIE